MVCFVHLTSKCASHHNGVHFFISHLASWLRTRRFSEPTFRPYGAPNHWKNTVFRDFPTFSRICIFFLLTLSLLLFFLLIFLFSLPLPCSAFHLSILSEVWLLNFLRQNIILKMCYRQSRREVSRQYSISTRQQFASQTLYTQKLLHTDAFTHKSFYTQKLLHTEAFTQKLSHTEAFTFRHFHTQALLHTDACAHGRFYTQALLHTEALHTDTFTPRRFYTQTLLHRRLCTRTLLHTDAFTHRRFYTQTVLHTNTFTQKHFYTQTLLHTDGFTHKLFYTQALLHTDAFTHRSFYTQTLLHTGRPMFTQSQWSHRCRGNLSNSTEGWSSYHVFGGHAFNIVQAIEVLLRQLWLQYR